MYYWKCGARKLEGSPCTCRIKEGSQLQSIDQVHRLSTNQHGDQQVTAWCKNIVFSRRTLLPQSGNKDCFVPYRPNSYYKKSQRFELVLQEIAKTWWSLKMELCTLDTAHGTLRHLMLQDESCNLTKKQYRSTGTRTPTNRKDMRNEAWTWPWNYAPLIPFMEHSDIWWCKMNLAT
jgi:hypothetical protein